MSIPVTRRHFIQSSAVAAGTAALTAKQYAQAQGANDRLQVGMIGCGGMAGSHLQALLSMLDEENIAIRWVCDVNPERADDFKRRVDGAGGKAKTTMDYREVLADGDIDYVVIATPEHSHFHLAMAALEAGKHVYCEKPMCYDIKEAKTLRAKAEETGLKLQVGVQGMADDSYSSAYQAILEGRLGKVVEAQIDYVRNHPTDRGPWRKSNVNDDTAMPAGLNWEDWLYPRAKRDWDPHHYFEWRCYRDYSGGISTDLFVHRVTRIIKACGLQFPTRVAGMGGIYTWDDGRDLPDSMEVLLEYPAIEGVTDGMTVHLLGTMNNKRGNPHYIRGQEATLEFTSSGWNIISEEDGSVIHSHLKTGGEDLVPHHKNHHEAIRNGVELFCPPELGLYGVAAARMGNLSWFERKMVMWDDAQEIVTYS